MEYVESVGNLKSENRVSRRGAWKCAHNTQKLTHRDVRVLQNRQDVGTCLWHVYVIN